MVGMDIQTRTIQLRGGPHDGATRIVPASLGSLYMSWNVERQKHCGRPIWGPVIPYEQDPKHPDQYHYQEH